jgi:hypothetical protein
VHRPAPDPQETRAREGAAVPAGEYGLSVKKDGFQTAGRLRRQSRDARRHFA